MSELKAEALSQILEHDRLIFGVQTAIVGGITYLIIDKAPTGWALALISVGLGLHLVSIMALVFHMNSALCMMSVISGKGDPEYNEARETEKFNRLKIQSSSHHRAYHRSFYWSIYFLISGIAMMVGHWQAWLAPLTIVTIALAKRWFRLQKN